MNDDPFNTIKKDAQFEPDSFTAKRRFSHLMKDPWAWATIILIGILVIVIALDVRVNITSARYTEPEIVENTQESQIPSQPTPPAAPYATIEKINEYADQLALDMDSFTQCIKEPNIEPIKQDLEDASALGVQGTPSFFINGELLVGAQPFEEFKRIIEHKLTNTTNTDNSEPTIVSIDNQPTLGKTDAPVTIVEFSEYQCPFCKRYYDGAYQDIKKQYVDTGKVKMVFRDFIIQGHTNAPLATLAAQCAESQGKYWEFHDLLFKNQEEWSVGDPSQ